MCVCAGEHVCARGVLVLVKQININLDKTVAKLTSVSHSRFTVEKDNITAED